MDIDSFYLALAQQSLEDCIKPEMTKTWIKVRKNDCSNNCSANSSSNFFPRTCCNEHIKHDKREPGLFKEELCCTSMICLCSKTYWCFDQKTEKSSSVATVSTKELWRKLAQDHCKNTELQFLRKNECSIYDSWVPNNSQFSLYIRTNNARVVIFLSKKNCSERWSSHKTPPLGKFSIYTMFLIEIKKRTTFSFYWYSFFMSSPFVLSNFF